MPKLNLGDNVAGHTYLGGDPNNKQSWINLDELAASGKRGDEFLNLVSQTHPSVVPMIKAMSEGKQSLPDKRAAAAPYWQTMLSMARMYDPTLDGIDYGVRYNTAKSFKGDGTSAQNIRNLNQGIGHLNALMDAVPGVAGHSGLLGMSHWLNQAENAYRRGNGDPGTTAYDVPRTALASELAAIFKGKGSSAEAEVKKFYEMLDISNSQAQKYAGARGLVDLLNSRLDELGQQYEQGMGKSIPAINLLNPITQKQFRRLRTIGLKPEEAAKVLGEAASGPTEHDDETESLLKKYGVNK